MRVSIEEESGSVAWAVISVLVMQPLRLLVVKVPS